MSGAELLDIFDDNGQRIGTKTRDAVHLNHDWHQLVFVWCAWRASDGLRMRPTGENTKYSRLGRMSHRSGQDGRGALRMLLQQRSRPDDPYVKSLDALAGGHVGAGEDHRSAARRELIEEVGIELTPDDLVYLGQRRLERHTGHCQRVIQHFYLWDGRMDPMWVSFSDEVQGVVELDLDELASLLAGERETIEGTARLASDPDELRATRITLESFSAYPEAILDIFRRSLRAVRAHVLFQQVDRSVWLD
jgi:8-oxo-dGTP pyrophosphatase MutT (NUDIX family)